MCSHYLQACCWVPTNRRGYHPGNDENCEADSLCNSDGLLHHGVWINLLSLHPLLYGRGSHWGRSVGLKICPHPLPGSICDWQIKHFMFKRMLHPEMKFAVWNGGFLFYIQISVWEVIYYTLYKVATILIRCSNMYLKLAKPNGFCNS